MDEIERLIEELMDWDSCVRAEAALALRRIGGGRAVEPLCRALGDEDSDVRERAAEALGNIDGTPPHRRGRPDAGGETERRMKG